MYTLRYTDSRVGELIHRWSDEDYMRALLVAQYVDRQRSSFNVVFEHDGNYQCIWPTY